MGISILDALLPSSVEVKKEQALCLLPLLAFMVCCSTKHSIVLYYN